MDKKSERFKELSSKKIRLIPYEIVKTNENEQPSNTQSANTKKNGN